MRTLLFFYPCTWEPVRARGLALFAVAVHHSHLMSEGLKNHSVASFDCTCCFPFCQTEGKEMAVFLKVLWALSTTSFLNHHITKPCKTNRVHGMLALDYCIRIILPKDFR